MTTRLFSSSLLSSSLLALALVACGGSSSSSSTETTETTGGEEHHEGGGDHHGGMSPELTAFHDVLAPIWHGDPATRGSVACEQATTLTERARAVGTGDGSQAAQDLVARVADLSTACGVDPSGAESALSAVHDAFHALMEAAHHAE